MRPKLISFTILALLFSSVLFISCSENDPESDLPNIVFIIADDISWDDFGCYGNTDVRTPNIDRVAGEGLLFTNMYLTASSCSPSRTSIISGRYPHNTGAAELHTPLPAHVPVFPEFLQEAGYFTAASGKWHMGESARRAFDTLAISEIGLSGSESWLNVMRALPADQPFFLWFASLDAHRDWSADTIADPHDPESLKVPVGLAGMDATLKDLASYYNEVWRFDYYVGLVIDELERMGVADNTLVIVTADNGRPFPRSKTRVYDSGMKTPFIAWWPEGIQETGVTVDALVSIIDMAPTLLTIAGIEPGPSFQGRSFNRLLETPGNTFRNYLFAEHNWHDLESYERMVRNKGFMYIFNGRPQFPNNGPVDALVSPSMRDLKALHDEGGLTKDQQDVFVAPRAAEELYDLRSDSDQVNNVIEEPRYAEELERLRNVMRRWQEETADNLPEDLTRDWFLRDAESYVQSEFHGVRGEMPGAASRADTLNASGPF